MFLALSDGAYIDTDEKLAEKIESSSDYIRLPNQYDIHEYNIMEDFAESSADVHKRERLLRALNSRKPFRHFKDALDYVGLSEAYYAFRSLVFFQISMEWCKENSIPYKIHEEKEKQ